MNKKKVLIVQAVAVLLATWIEIATAQMYNDNGRTYYNNMVYINGEKEDGWRMVPHYEHHEQMGIPPVTKKSSGIHNYFVFGGRKYDIIKRIPTSKDTKQKYPDWIVHSHDPVASAEDELPILTPHEKAVDLPIEQPEPIQNSELDPDNIPASSTSEIKIEQKEIDPPETTFLEAKEPNDPALDEEEGVETNGNTISLPVNQGEIDSTSREPNDDPAIIAATPEEEEKVETNGNIISINEKDIEQTLPEPNELYPASIADAPQKEIIMPASAEEEEVETNGDSKALALNQEEIDQTLREPNEPYPAIIADAPPNEASAKEEEVETTITPTLPLAQEDIDQTLQEPNEPYPAIIAEAPQNEIIIEASANEEEAETNGNTIALPLNQEEIDQTLPESTELYPASIADAPQNEIIMPASAEEDKVETIENTMTLPVQEEEIMNPEADPVNIPAPLPPLDPTNTADTENFKAMLNIFEDRIRKLYTELIAESQAQVVGQPISSYPAIEQENNPATKLSGDASPFPVDSPIVSPKNKEQSLDPVNTPSGNYIELQAKKPEDRCHLAPIVVVVQPKHISPGNPVTPIIYGPPVYTPSETYASQHNFNAISPEYRLTPRASDEIATENDLELDQNSVMTYEDAHHLRYFTNLIIGKRFNELNRQSKRKPHRAIEVADKKQ